MALLRLLCALACVAVAVRAGYVPAASPTYLPTNWMTVNTGTSVTNYVANPSGTQIAVTYSGQVSNTNLTLINSQTGVQVATQVFTDSILSVNWVSDSLIAVAFTSSIQGLSSTLSPVWTITTTVVAPVTVIGNGSYLWFNTPGSNNNQVAASSVVDLRTGKTMWSSLLVTSTLGSTLICASSLWCGLYIGSVSKFFVINALNGTVVASLAVPLSSLASVTVALGSDSDCVAVDCALSFSTATTLVMVTLQQLTKAWVVKIARQISVGTDLYTAALPIAPFSNNLQQPWLVAMAFGRNITFYSVGDGSIVGSIPTVNSNQADNYVIGMVVVPKSATSMTFIASLAYNTTNPMIPTALAATLTLDISSGNITVTTSWSSTFLGMSYGFPSPTVAVNSVVFVPLCGSNPSTGCILIDAHTGQTAYTLAFAAANVFVASSFPIVVAGSGLVIRSMQQLASFNTQVTSTVLSSGSGDTNSKIFSITDSFAVAVQNSPTATRITSISNANTVAPIFNQAASLTIPASTFFGVAGDIFFAVSVVGTQSQLYLISASNSSLALIGSAAILIPAVVTGAKGTSSGAIVVWSLTQVLVVNGKSQHTMALTSNTVVACIADSSRIFILTSADLIAYDLTLTPLWTATAGGGIASTLTLGPDFNGTSTLAHYNNGGNTFWVRDRATGSVYFTWDGPNCVGPITVFRGQYWMTVASQITGALPTSQSYLFRLNLESPALSGYYPLYGVPQTPNYYQFSDLGILAIAGTQNLLVLNLFTGTTMWSWGTDIMLSNEGIGIVSLTADSKNVVIFIAHQTNPSVRVVVRNIFTGAEVLAFPATNFYSEQPLPGPNNCNAVLLGSGLDGSVEQYACLPIPSVTVPLTWNSNAALLQPSSEVSFPGSTAAPMTTSTPAPKHDDDNKPGSSSHVVVIAIIIAIVVVGGGATAFFVRRRRNARNNEIGYGIIRDDRSMVNAK